MDQINELKENIDLERKEREEKEEEIINYL